MARKSRTEGFGETLQDAIKRQNMMSVEIKLLEETGKHYIYSIGIRGANTAVSKDLNPRIRLPIAVNQLKVN